MKKIIYLFTFCFLLSAFSLNAQIQFPDSSFEGEGWKKITSGLNGPYDEFSTTFFYTLNSLFALDNKPVADLTAYKDGDAQHGQYCIKLVSGQVGVGEGYVFLPGMVGTINEAFVREFLESDSAAISVTKDWYGYNTPCALEGWYKYNPGEGDSAVIEIGFYDHLEEGFLVRYIIKETVNDWKHFSVPIPKKYWNEEYSWIRALFVASAKINWDNLMQCDGKLGSTLWIDNISLKYSCNDTNGIKQNLFSTLKANIFPNPATEVLNMELNEHFNGTISVYNFTGSKILEENINGTKCQLNTSLFAAGNYIYKLMNGNTIFAQGKFVVTK